MSDLKFYLNEQELEMLQTRHPGLYDKIKDNVYPLGPIVRRADVMRNLNESLGAIASEYGYRVAEGPEVSELRDLGQRPATVYFDEAHNLTEIYDAGESSVVAQKWMEHRRICRRALLECLSGETH